MHDSLPVPPSSQQELQDFLSHALQPLTARNSSATQSPRTFGLKPLTNEEVNAFAQKLLQRLPPAFVTEFFRMLQLMILGQDDEAEKPRVGQLAKMFADAHEQELWEEYVDLFMPQWIGELKFEEEEDGVIEAMRGDGRGGM
ncbi:MAG: hypothetical protein LQ341_007860 [Variospora aurantia]|nr:MAG: hypothetical protein LQ341_007860 [Variospora aurantia]